MPTTKPNELSTDKGIRTYEHILDAAARVVFETGLPNFTFRAVAAEAGLSRGALLHYFQNKQQLVELLYGHLCGRRENELESRIGGLTETQRKADQAATEIMLEVAKSPNAIVMREIETHSRTDASLRRIVKREKSALRQKLLEFSKDNFPEWQSEENVISVAQVLVLSIADGFAHFEMSGEVFDNEEFVAAVKKILRHLRDNS